MICNIFLKVKILGHGNILKEFQGKQYLKRKGIAEIQGQAALCENSS